MEPAVALAPDPTVAALCSLRGATVSVDALEGLAVHVHLRVGEQPVEAVEGGLARIDAKLHAPPFHQPLHAVSCFRPTALDWRVRFACLGRVDADQPEE